MSRTHKLVVCLGFALAGIVATAVIGWEIVGTRAAVGSAAAPVTASGWSQLVLALLSVFGFSGAGIWQAAAAFVESRGAAIVRQVAPNLGEKTTQELVDVGKIATMLALVNATSDAATKSKWIEAARLEFDNLRDLLFPLSNGAQ